MKKLIGMILKRASCSCISFRRDFSANFQVLYAPDSLLPALVPHELFLSPFSPIMREKSLNVKRGNGRDMSGIGLRLV